LFRIAGMNIYDRTDGRTRAAGGEKDTTLKNGGWASERGSR